MKASEFLGIKKAANLEPVGKKSAKDFLQGDVAPEVSDPFTSPAANAPAGHDPFTAPVDQKQRPMLVSVADFLTGHFPEQKDVPEVQIKDGKLVTNAPESAEMPFLQDPVTAASFGLAAGIRAPVQKVLTGTKEAAAWLTGGGTEALASVAKGVKGSAKEFLGASSEAGRIKNVDVIDQPVRKMADYAPSTQGNTPGAPLKVSPESLEALVKGGKVGELPKYAEGSAINLERLDTTQDVKQFLNTLTSKYEQEIGKQKVTWAETEKAAEELAWDAKEFLKQAKKKDGFSAAEIHATRQIHANALHDLFTTIRDIPADSTMRTDAMRLGIVDKVNNYIEIMKATSQKSSEAGRALNVHKKMIMDNPEFAQDAIKQKVLKQILDANGGTELTDRMISDLQKIDFADPKAVRDVLQKYHKAGIMDMIYEAWLNGLLSAPVSHAANMLGNTLTMATKIPETAIAKLLRGKSPIGEIKAETVGLFQGMKEGVRASIRTFIDGVSPDLMTKIEHQRFHSIPGKAGEAVRIPTRALTAEDEFYKAINYRAELNRRAYQIAEQEGLSGQQMATRMAELINDVTSPLSRGLHAKAREEALYRTFNKPLGEFGSSIMRLRDKVPGVKYIVPFIRTPVNIAKFTLERTPFNFAKIAHDYKVGKISSDELSQELAKPILGSLLSAATTMAVLEGNVTGGPPKDKKERQLKYASGWQPYSIKIGDTYYSYNRLEPIGSILGMTADFVDAAKSDSEINERAGKVMISFSRNIASKTFLQGISGVLDAISDPERYGGNIVSKFAGSVVPSVVASGARATDPFIREVKTPLDAIKARIPELSKDLPRQEGVKTVFGELPAERSGSPLTRFLSPVQVSEEKNAAVRAAIQMEYDKLNENRRVRKEKKELMEKILMGMRK